MATEAYSETYRALFNAAPPARHERGTSGAQIFSKGSGFLAGFDLSMQLQVGCPGGCLYCYVTSSPWFTSTRARGRQGELWGYRLYDKGAALTEFAGLLAAGALADKTIYWSGVTDPYAAAPKVTKSIWELLLDAPGELRPRRMVVQTRFRPDRDAELMGRYTKETETSDGGPAVVVSYSIGTDREDLIRAWEKSTPSYADRMKCAEKLRGEGVTVVPTLSPFGYWDDLKGTLETFKSFGIPYVTALFFKLPDRYARAATTPTRFLDYLEREHPELLDAEWQAERLIEMREVMGEGGVIPGQEGFETLTRPQRVVVEGG